MSYNGYPGGYHHDLALVKVDRPTIMIHADQLEWNTDPSTLFYNKQLQLLSRGPLPVNDGRGRPVEWGATVGQSIVRNEPSVRKLGVEVVDGKMRYKTDALPPVTANHFSRAYVSVAYVRFFPWTERAERLTLGCSRLRRSP